jgi:methyl-accepting chemotaxis protein
VHIKMMDKKLGWLKPGVWLARQMRLPVKLGLTALVLLVPLLVFALLLVQRQTADLNNTHAESEGIQVVRPVLKVVALVQRHRGLSAIAVASKKPPPADIEKVRSELSDTVGKVQSSLKSASSFSLDKEWSPLSSRLLSLGGTPMADEAAALRLHDELVRDLRYFIANVGESSGLLYEPEAAPYLLMDMVLFKTTAWGEQVAQFRGRGALELARPTPDPVGNALMRDRAAQVLASLADQRFARATLARNGESGFGTDTAIKAAEAFASMGLGTFAEGGGAARDPVAFFNTGNQALDAVLAFEGKMLDKLDSYLAARSKSLNFARNWVVGGLATGFLLMVYLMMTFYRSVMIDVGRLSFAMGELSRGNLRVVATTRAKDEIGELAVILKTMIANISGMVAAVGSDAALVAHAGRSLSEGNRELAERTAQQTANLQQTSTNVQGVAQTVVQNADTAKEVDTQAVKVRGIAESGAKSMQASIQSVEAIQESAKRMNEIIGVIDGLAFQTNILALNAAVEAARAGESGRGFAVVATEVRSLAQRSAESAREIRNLIQDSSNQVAASVEKIRTAGEGMTRIVSGIRTVSSSISQISQASAEQSAGIREISAAVAELDEITQRNASMVARAVSQSDGLEVQGANLSQAIGTFKLQQGVAQEALALVQRAQAHRKDFGGRDAFWDSITDKANNFYDRDMYVFVLGRDGTYHAFGGNPAKIGTRVHDLPGVDGNAMMEAIARGAGDGEGWAEYSITNPASGKVQFKISYVNWLDGAYLGCGVYKNLVAA